MRNALDRHLEKRGTLFAFCGGGVLGVLVDADHVLKYYLFPGEIERFLHTPLLIVCCIALCGCGAYLAGLYLKSLLKGKP